MHRKSAAWMKGLDDRILEVCDQYGLVSLGFLTHEVSVSASLPRVRERCHMLADADLLDLPLRDMVELTTWGQLYLDGEVDVGLHEPPWVMHPVMGYELPG